VFSIVFILEINNSRNRVLLKFTRFHTRCSLDQSEWIPITRMYEYTHTKVRHICIKYNIPTYVFTRYGNISRCLDGYNDDDDNNDNDDDDDDDGKKT